MKSWVALSLLILTLSPGMTSADNFQGITEISVSPKVFFARSNISVYVTFADTINVSGVRITYCRVLPEYLCYFPSYKATNSTEDTTTYSVDIQLKDEDLDGYTIGLRVLVSYMDSSSIDIPDADTPDFGLSVIEPEEGLFYFGFTLGGEGSSSSTSTATPFFISSSILALLLRRRKARPLVN